MHPPIIFVVDDDPSVRSALRRLLFQLRHPVQVFDSAERFLADVRPGTRGCLILDLSMPGMNGLQLLEHLSRDQWNLPTIAISGDLDDEPRAVALRLGAIAALSKPFDRESLVTSVRAAIARSQAEANGN